MSNAVETDTPEFKQYVESCNYPGVLDEEAVNQALQDYLKSLKLDLKVKKISKGWKLEDEPSLIRYVDEVLKRLPKKDDETENQDS